MHTTLLRTVAATSAAFLLAPRAGAQIQFDPPATYLPGQLPSGVVFGDFDADGDRDMAVTSDAPDKVALFTNDGAGGFTGPVFVNLGAGVSAQDLVAADLDGDGDLDLAVALKNANAVRVLTNTGGVFSLGQQVATGGDEARELAVGDLDGDGDPDLAVSNRKTDDVSVLRNNGGTLTLMGPFAAGAEPRKLVIAELTGDGNADVAVSAHDDRNVNILAGNGAGSLSLVLSLSLGAQLRPDGLTAADLDGNGALDLAAGTSGNGLNFVSVFMGMAGGMAFSGPFNYASGGVNPDGVASADFDGDGLRDVVTSHQDSNDFGALAGVGGGALGAPTNFATGARPGDIAVGDLDGNGSPDLAVVDRDSNDVMVFLNAAAGGSCPDFVFCDANPDNAADLTIDNCVCAAGSASLQLSNAPASQFGYPLVGAGNQTVTNPPGAQGDLCLAGATIGRYSADALLTDAAGNASVDVLNAASGGGGGNIPTIGGNLCSPPNQTWNFQWWHRDGMNPSKFSKAIQVTFN